MPLQEVRVQNISARLPEHLAAGVYATGAVVLAGANEVMLDFVQSVGRSPRIVSRVILAPVAARQVAEAMEQSAAAYRDRHGALPEPLPGSPAERPSIEEVYERFKLPEDLLGGAYANGVLVSFGPAEFALEFVASLYPRAVVASRVFLGAAHLPSLLMSLRANLRRYAPRPGRVAGGEDRPPTSPPTSPPLPPPSVPPMPPPPGIV